MQRIADIIRLLFTIATFELFGLWYWLVIR